jgi:hypothetical protein
MDDSNGSNCNNAGDKQAVDTGAEFEQLTQYVSIHFCLHLLLLWPGDAVYYLWFQGKKERCLNHSKF